MDNEKIGRFITDLRKSNQMTQRELADKLNISDKAVSKWERGLSYPDITLLIPLSSILGITVTELLNGERALHEDPDVEKIVVNALEYSNKATRSKIVITQNIRASAFSFLLFIAIAVVTIVDIANTGTLTWAGIPIVSILFAWLMCFPTIKSGAKGIVYSLVAFSVFIIPYLYILNRLLGGVTNFLAVSIRVSVITIIYMWIIYGIYRKQGFRKLIASAVVNFLSIPFSLIINYTIASIIGGVWFDAWNLLGFVLIIIISAILVAIDVSRRKVRV
ncbi:MAG: helix-turn-helix domain-containing protein [Oscillospiraceae bacterium]|nr:helix-turn-helix domain-containing protein [Oscillospiraceae bacterium]